MFISGTASEGDRETYRKEFLKKGQSEISKFPILYSILKDFPEFKVENYDFNFFLLLASSAKYDPFLKAPNNDSLARLQKYEKLLSEIGLLEYPSAKRRDIIAKMNSFDWDQNHTLIKEFELLIQLRNNPKLSDVVYSNFEDSNHDYRFSAGGTEFNLELTSLGKSKPANIMEKAFNQAARKMIVDLPGDKVLRLDILTDKLLNKDSAMDEDYIINLLTSYFKRLLPIIVVKCNGFCIFNFNFGDPEKSLFEFKDIFKYYDQQGERLLELLHTPSGVDYLKKTKLHQLIGSPFKGFTYTDAKPGLKLVEVTSSFSYPSVAQSLRETALLKQLKRSIVAKIKKNQLDSQQNPILIVQFNDLLFKGYSRKDELFGEEYLSKLKGIVMEAFEENISKNILGCILIEDFLSSAKFISNPKISLSLEIAKTIREFASLC